MKWGKKYDIIFINIYGLYVCLLSYDREVINIIYEFIYTHIPKDPYFFKLLSNVPVCVCVCVTNNWIQSK